jgi:hypothetical protein
LPLPMFCLPVRQVYPLPGAEGEGQTVLLMFLFLIGCAYGLDLFERRCPDPLFPCS